MNAELEVEFDMDLGTEIDSTDVFTPSSMDAFYDKEFFFSYSSRKLLMYNPPTFAEKYINNIYEERLDKHLIAGKLIHCLILEPEKLDELFIISPLDTPTGKTRNIIHSVVKEHKRLMNPDDSMYFADYSSFILNQLVEQNLHQSLTDDKKVLTNTGDSKRLAKMLTDENSSYFDYMVTRGSKTVTDEKMMEFCKRAADVILMNQKLTDLMGITNLKEADEVFNEKMMFMKLSKYSFGLKGILDNYVIKHSEKKIIINDFKTTNKELAEFSKAIGIWGYDAQAVIYLMLIWSNHTELIDDGYSVEFNFITVDKNLQAYAFSVTEDTRKRWLEEFYRTLDHMNYHYTNKDYTLPYAFATGIVLL